jgi:hypothetical protein
MKHGVVDVRSKCAFHRFQISAMRAGRELYAVAYERRSKNRPQNPRFGVTSLTAEQWAAQNLYEKLYCARGEVENRIKERMCLFAYRLSTEEMKGNQLRLYFSALAYTQMEALRRLGLKGTKWAQAQVDTIPPDLEVSACEKCGLISRS